MRRFAFALVLLPFAFAACGKSSSPQELAAAAAAQKVSNTVCPVMGNPVDLSDPDTFVEYKGERIAFCCGPCRPKFLKDPEKYMKVLRDDPKKYGYHAP